MTFKGQWSGVTAFGLFILANTGYGQVTPNVADNPSQVGALEEIVVTAQKREENLQRVPVAIAAVSSIQLQAAGVESVQDLSSAVPGLTLLNIAGAISPRIRGVGSTTVAIGIEAPVAVYVDGVYYANSADLAGDLQDVSQISVLKGPQGTLFGRNATGGVIQISTVDPGQNFKVDAATAIDNYLTSRSYVYVGGPISPTISAGISTQYARQGDGWGTNEFNGQDVHKIDNQLQTRVKFIFAPTESTNIKLAADYFDINGSLASVYRDGVGYPRTFGPVIPGRAYNVDDYIQPYIFNRGFGASLVIAQDFSFAKLTSISAYRDSSHYYQFDTTSNIEGLGAFIREYSRQFTEEVQLVSSGASRMNWAIGAYYFHENAAPTQDDVLEPGFTKSIPIGIHIPTSQSIASPAAFAQATYSVTSTTRLTAGTRYTEEKKLFTGGQTGFLLNVPTVIIPPLTRPISTSSLTSSKPTFRLGVDQELAPDVMAYASYNRGFKSGGFNVRDPTNPPYQPEILDAYEVGIKSEMMAHRVRVNGSAFFYNYKDLQIARYTTTAVIYNGAGARIAGVDFDAEAKVTEALRFNASVEYLHSYFTSFAQAQFSRYTPNPDGTAIFPIHLYSGDATGHALPYSPKITYTLGADYEIKTGVGPITLNATDIYNGGFYFEPDNFLRQNSYHLVNTSVAWQSSDSHYGLRVYVNNILNKAIPSQFATASFGFIGDYTNPPRLIGARVEVSF